MLHVRGVSNLGKANRKFSMNYEPLMNLVPARKIHFNYDIEVFQWEKNPPNGHLRILSVLIYYRISIY